MATQKTLLDGDTGQKFDSSEMIVGEALVAVDASALQVTSAAHDATSPSTPLTSGSPSHTFTSNFSVADQAGTVLLLEGNVQFTAAAFVASATPQINVNATWGARSAERFGGGTPAFAAILFVGAGNLPVRFSYRLAFTAGALNAVPQPIALTFSATGLPAAGSLSIQNGAEFSPIYLSRALLTPGGLFVP